MHEEGTAHCVWWSRVSPLGDAGESALIAADVGVVLLYTLSMYRRFFPLKHDSQSPWGTNGDVIFPSWLDSLSGLGALVSCFAWFCHWLPSATRGCHVHRGTACTSARICEAAEPGAIRTADLGRLGCGLTVGVSRVWRSGMPDFVALPRCCLFVVAG